MSPFLRKMIISIVLEKAIVFEEEAYQFYDRAFLSVKDKSAKNMLHALRSAELNHRIKLESIQKSKEYTIKFKEIEIEIELPPTSEDILKWPTIAQGLSLREILLIALGKEKEAYSYYKNIYKHIHLQFLKEVFTFLMNEELKHVKLVEEELQKQ